MFSNCYDLYFSSKLTERVNNHQKIQASHRDIEQNAKFSPLNFYVVQMLNTQLEFPCEVAPFLGGHGWFIPL